MHHQIRDSLSSNALKIGRDGLFDILRKYGMLIQPKRRYVRTTMSRHWLRKYPNLFKSVSVSRADEVWVSDITYIKTDQGNCYLNLITDVWSRKIVGFAIADNMETRQMKQAFLMALEQREIKNGPLIHHSDRGLQYCSAEYTGIAIENNIKISMTENGDPYENALAERMNRTLKEEFGLGKILASKHQAKLLVNEAVNLYNNYRPHLSLQMKTPQSVYKQKSPILANQGLS